MEVSGLTDEQLLEHAARSSAAFEEFYRRHVGKVVSFSARRCSAPNDVPDLVAAVWLEVIESAPRFDSRRGRAVPWLLGIAANLVASEARRHRREGEARARLNGQRLLEEDDYVRLEEQMAAERIAPQLRDALWRLPAGERAVAELVVAEGFSPADAAGALGIGSTTARMRLTRARRKLRRSLSAFQSDSVDGMKEAAP
jgi:RNA polymerase sigma factor (sigma-70 family)